MTRNRSREWPKGQRSRPLPAMTEAENLDGPDGEHAEVHERQPPADQRQAAELRDVEHLRDWGDVAQRLRPGRHREERALRARALPSGGRGQDVAVDAPR